MTEIVGTDRFEDWFLQLDDARGRAVVRVVGLLEHQGVALGFPYSSAIRGSRYPLRELRIQSAGKPLRILYAFDPSRQAVLLIGGAKTGDDRFYGRIVSQAEDLWEQYLREHAAKGDDS